MSQIEQKDTFSEDRKTYTPRPKWQLMLAWIGIAVVLFAFFGTLYWMMTFRV